MMQPLIASLSEGEKTRKPRGEKTRSRGAGEKAKERKVCREHPGKGFNHASDYKYEFPAQGWEQRMEHAGQHYEKNNYKEFSSNYWVPDEGLIKWALEHGIIEENNDGSYTIISTEEDAFVKAGVEQKKLAREGMAGVGYADDDLDFDAEGDDEY